MLYICHVKDLKPTKRQLLREEMRLEHIKTVTVLKLNQEKDIRFFDRRGHFHPKKAVVRTCADCG